MAAHASAHDVARYLIWLAANECADDPDYLTPLKLQKLLYFVQGWGLVEWGQPVFDEPVEAWRQGPVVASVYDRYKHRSKLPITEDELGSEPIRLSEQEKSLIHSVWDAYKQYSAFGLSAMTHDEEPYLEVYRPHDDAGRCRQVIRTDRMKRSFDAKRQSASRWLSKNRRSLLDAARPARPGDIASPP